MYFERTTNESTEKVFFMCSNLPVPVYTGNPGTRRRTGEENKGNSFQDNRRWRHRCF